MKDKKNMMNEKKIHELLKDPIRARIFFEIMVQIKEGITIKQLSKLMSKDRTTINHHINILLDAGIVVTLKEKKHTRGKPTRYFGLRKKGKEIEVEIEEKTEKEKSLENLSATVKNMRLYAAVAEHSYENVKEKEIKTCEGRQLVLLTGEKGAELYNRKFNEFLKIIMVEMDEVEETEKTTKMVIFSTIFPIIRE
jgi:DNA-binding transcriptional ArsR family regulator